MSRTRVFISHAAKDKSVVDLFFDLLQTGLNLSPNETFCSSLEGMGIPAGENFVEHIKGKVQNPDLILLILSPHYLESLFCLCELGAGWVLSHNMIPLLVPPTQFSELKAVLAGIHAYRMNVDTDLAELRDQMIGVLKLEAPKSARWDAKRKQFLEALPVTLAKIEPPQRIPFSEHVTLKQKYEESVSELRDCLNEIDSLKQQIAQLKECKDRDEVQAVARQFSNEWDQFEQLCEVAEGCSGKVPSMAIEAIYHDVTGKSGIPRGNQIWDELRSAEQDDYLHISPDNEVSVNYDDPSVARYVAAVEQVQHFLGELEESEHSSFRQEYAEKYAHQPNFASRKVWEEHLGLASYTKW